MHFLFLKELCYTKHHNNTRPFKSIKIILRTILLKNYPTWDLFHGTLRESRTHSLIQHTCVLALSMYKNWDEKACPSPWHFQELTVRWESTETQL